ncbi:MAG: glutamate racemase [Nitrospirota bacterium]
MSDAAIGVFDSGIGGLTVVRELMKALPGEGIIYLGDTARVPYGIRSPETVRRYAAQGAAFLLRRGVKLLVVACNTMSAVALEAIPAKVPVVGVILPGARAAAEGSETGRIGVIGTEATVRSGAYEEAIRALNPQAEVFSLPCPLFVPLVEEGWLEGEVPRLAAAEYLGRLLGRGMDTLVLGCTHYPLLKPVIAGVAGEGVRLIDSAQETAREVKEHLGGGKGPLPGDPPAREFYVTDGPGKFRSVGGRFLGADIDNVTKVQLEVQE